MGTDRIRARVSGRVERSDQQVLTFNLFNRELNPVLAGQDKTDVMPSFGVAHGLNHKMNLRVGYSQTVARPQFRELSPFEFTDVTGGPSAVGNPDLVRTNVRNFDARWEWFLSAQELVAVSFFYKKLLNPIEQVIQPSNELTIVSYRNVEGAKNWGLEFEIRKNLGGLSPRLAGAKDRLRTPSFKISSEDCSAGLGGPDTSSRSVL